MLDARRKILPLAQALEKFQGRPVVAGYFDPLVSSHTARLAELAAIHGLLAVCVCELPDALLPARSRAELAAACRVVELVTVAEPASLQGCELIDERPADLRRRAGVGRWVLGRQEAAGDD